jgi:hypothetical protein
VSEGRGLRAEGMEQRLKAWRTMKLFNPLCARHSALSPRRINEEEPSIKYIIKASAFMVILVKGYFVIVFASVSQRSNPLRIKRLSR